MRAHPGEVQSFLSLKPEKQEDLLLSLLSSHANVLDQVKKHVNILSNLPELSHLDVTRIINKAEAALTHSEPTEARPSDEDRSIIIQAAW